MSESSQQDRSNVPSKMDWVSLINESVHTSDDVDIGDVEAVSRSFVVVKRGFVNIHHYYIPINKVDGWDGNVLWLTISENDVNEKYERDVFPDPYNYYLKDYPYYTSRHYPDLRNIPPRYIAPSFRLRADETSNMTEISREYQCDLCNTKFGTDDELSNHVDHSH